MLRRFLKTYSSNPLSLVLSLVKNKELFWALVKRDITGKYKGSSLGMFWSVITPFFMLAIYTFVFSYIFKAKWGTGIESKGEFALVLFVGLMVYNFFSEVINQSATIYINNANYVKKVVFPLEILPCISLTSAFFNFAISFSIWFFASFWVFDGVTYHALFLPILMMPLVIITLSFSMLISALGVYLRDISQFTNLIILTLMFLSPIFYSISLIPEQYQSMLMLNPIAYTIVEARKVLVHSHFPNFYLWGGYLAASLFIFLCSFTLFQKMRRGFADVL